MLNKVINTYRELAERRKRVFYLLHALFGVFIGVGAVLGSYTSIKSFYDDVVHNNAESESAFYGAWFSEYSYPLSLGTVSVSGTTQYLNNNHYNYSGTMTFHFSDEQGSYRVVAHVNAAGEWQAKPDSHTVLLTSMKSYIKSLHRNGKLVDSRLAREAMGGVLPRIEDEIPSGQGQEYRVLDISAKSITLETSDPKGNKLQIKLLKRLS